MTHNLTLKSLYLEIHDTQGDEAHKKLLSLPQRLRAVEGTAQEDATVYAEKLATWVAELILPDKAFSVDEVTLEDDESDESMRRAKLKESYVAGLESLWIVDGLIPDQYGHPESENSILLSVVAFTYPEDGWTSSKAVEIAQKILDRHSDLALEDAFRVEFVLKNYLRKLFVGSRPTTITTQGRKAISPYGPGILDDDRTMDSSRKPWKSVDVAAQTVFDWIIQNAEPSFISSNWPLLIPPLLTMLDDNVSAVRARALRILRQFLTKTPAKMLAQTGLAEVFEDTVMPALLFLPELTPMAESLAILELAYEALFALTAVRYTAVNANVTREESHMQKMKFLGRILLNGVIQSYQHCSNHQPIVQLVVRKARHIIDEMGICAVVHLKDIIPMVSQILSNPFALACLPLLQDTLELTQTVVLNCWPRVSIDVYKNELIKSLLSCWYAIKAEEPIYEDIKGGEQGPTMSIQEYRSIKEMVKRTTFLFIHSMKGEATMSQELALLLQRDQSLRELLTES